MTPAEIVKKLIGNINPAGDASVDPDRLENLRLMCETVSELIEGIRLVSEERNSYQHSVQLAGQYASDFLQEIKEQV